MGYVEETTDRMSEHENADPSAVIETLQSILIAFIVAFIFKHFVAEAYVIPTGSMAPTLLGAHLDMRGPDSGYPFITGPGYGQTDSITGFANPLQEDVYAQDPILWNQHYARSKASSKSKYGPRFDGDGQARIRMGDRIFVQRYLYALLEPKRFDVVVFKWPKIPETNFIKRLVGLPNESVWLADGDVFAREQGTSAYLIQRKPDHVQRAVWQNVYNSDYIPGPNAAYRPKWTPPWSGQGTFDVDGRSYQSTQVDSILTWQNSVRPINDENFYNFPYPLNKSPRGNLYGVSDIRLASGIRPESEGLVSHIRLQTRGFEFQAVFGDSKVILRMRDIGTELDWSTLMEVQTEAANFPADKTTNVEFWHVDQALKVWLDGNLIAESTYDWQAQTRLGNATGLHPDEAKAIRQSYVNPYMNPRYKPAPPEISWQFSGSRVTMYHVELDRDLYYRPEQYRNGGPPGNATGADERYLMHLRNDEFFMCGDNSSASNDGRTWDSPSPWVSSMYGVPKGVVPRKLILGKAFFVYYPSPEGITEGGTRYVPNFGEMRLIR